MKVSRVSLAGDENILKLLMVMVVQLMKIIKHYCIAHIKWVNCVAYESYFNKVMGKVL